MIYPYQRGAYEELRRTFEVHALVQEMDLKIRPRTHRVVIGSTGTGKTHLVTTLAEELGWHCLHLNTPSWVIAGARGNHTWPQIVSWVDTRDEHPLVVVLDELDKVSGDDDSWTSFLRSEVQFLLDGKIPPGEYEVEHNTMDEIRKRLRETLVIGIGAFQSTHDKKPAMGFNPGAAEALTPAILSDHLQRELVNRFNDKAIQIPSPQAGDYEAMIGLAAKQFKGGDSTEFKAMGKAGITDAVTGKVGARYVEGVVYRFLEQVAIGRIVEPTEDELWGENY